MVAHHPIIVAGRQDNRAQPAANRGQIGHIDPPRDGIELIGQYVSLEQLPVNLSVITVPDQFHVFRADQLSLHLAQWRRALDSTLQQAGVMRSQHHKAVLQRGRRVSTVGTGQDQSAGCVLLVQVEQKTHVFFFALGAGQ